MSNLIVPTPTALTAATPAEILDRRVQAQLQLNTQMQAQQSANPFSQQGQYIPPFAPPAPPPPPPFDPALLERTEMEYWTVCYSATGSFDVNPFVIEKIVLTFGDATIRPDTRKTIPALLFRTEAEARKYLREIIRETYRGKLREFIEQLTTAGLKGGPSDDPEIALLEAIHTYLKDIAP